MIVAKKICKKFEVATVQLFSLLQLPELALLPGRFFSKEPKTENTTWCLLHVRMRSKVYGSVFVYLASNFIAFRHIHRVWLCVCL